MDLPFIIRGKSKRVATGFLVTMPVDAVADDCFSYQHVYAVTARHCAYSESSGYRTLKAESPWMDLQPLATAELSSDRWSNLQLADLLDEDDPANRPGEEMADLAVQLAVGMLNYSGIVIGRSLRALPAARLFDFTALEDEDVLGLETATTGLFHFYAGTDAAIEPIVRFGRVVMQPKGVVQGREGKMQAILIESLASEGMSGSPVFVNAGGRDPHFLGVHVGHAKDRDGGAHSGVSLVAPAGKLLQLLQRSDLVSARERIAQQVSGSAWRFRDMRHRLRYGLSLTEESFATEDDYYEEHPMQISFLLVSPVGEPGGVRDFWNELPARPLADIEEVAATVASFFSEIAWTEHFYRRSGWGLWRDGETYANVDIYADGVSQVEAIWLDFDLEELQAATGRIRPSTIAINALRQALGATHLIDLHQDEVLHRPSAQTRPDE